MPETYDYITYMEKTLQDMIKVGILGWESILHYLGRPSLITEVLIYYRGKQKHRGERMPCGDDSTSRSDSGPQTKELGWKARNGLTPRVSRRKAALQTPSL